MTLRTLFYSQDGFGLGHLRRTTTLAARLVAVYPDAEVLMLTDSPRPDFFPSPPRTRSLTLPCLIRTGPNRWRPGDPRLSLADVLARRRAAIVEAVTSFSPELVVVDHLPLGAAGELVPVLTALRAAGARLVLGLRDILDAPSVVRPLWLRDGSYAALRDVYDAVLVYGSETVFDLARAYALPPLTAAKVRYCGYVAAPRAGGGSAGGEAAWPRIVTMAGGGADAHAFLDAVVDGVAALGSGWEAVAVTGPFLPSEQRDSLRERAASLPVRILESVADVPSVLAEGSVVISRAGYNSTVEACASGVPAVLVPRAGPSQEQRLRASLFASRGWVQTIGTAPPSGATIAEAVRRAMAEDVSGRPDLGGLDRAVGHLLDVADVAAAVPASPVR